MSPRNDDDDLQAAIAEGVPLDAKERYAFQLVGSITLIVPIRCKCRPNNFLQINGIGHTVTCDFCGFRYWIHQVLYNGEDPSQQNRAQLGVAIYTEAPAVARAHVKAPS